MIRTIELFFYRKGEVLIYFHFLLLSLDSRQHGNDGLVKSSRGKAREALEVRCAFVYAAAPQC